MSGLSLDVQVDALGRRVVARELDVAAIRAHLAGAGERVVAESFDTVGFALFEGINFDDLLVMSDVTADELGRLMPSEIRAIIAACREVNPDFFGMLARLQKGG